MAEVRRRARPGSGGLRVAGQPGDCTVRAVRVGPVRRASDSLRALSDGAGGAFVAWTDWRTFSATNLDVYLHRFLAGGTLDPAWPVNGLSTRNLAGTQNRSMLVSDDDGGVIVVWWDGRMDSTGGSGLYAQRVTPEARSRTAGRRMEPRCARPRGSGPASRVHRKDGPAGSSLSGRMAAVGITTSTHRGSWRTGPSPPAG